MPPVNPPKSQQTTRNDSRSSAFDFESFSRSLEEQNALAAARQAEQVRTAQAQGDIAQRSARLAKEQQDSMSFLLKDVQTAQQKAAHARQLADSANPLDTLRLIGLQQLDPNGYLREQREARLQEDRLQAATLNTYFAAGQDALQKELLASTANLDVLKNLESIGNEKLTTYAKNAQLMHGQLSAIQSMKDDAIYGLDENQLAAAIAQAKSSANRMANVGGIDVDVRTLEDRQTALADRRYNMLTKQTAMRLAEYDAAHVDDTLAQKDFERKQNQELRDSYETDKAIRQGQRREQANQLIDAANKRILGGMTTSELMKIRTNNYRDESGEQYTPADVDQAYAARKQVEADQINDQVLQNQLSNFDVKSLADEKARVESTVGRFKEGTAAARAQRDYVKALHVAALGVGPENGLVTRLTAMEIYGKARQDYDRQLQAQAKADAKNDKDVEELRLEWYRGNPVPRETLYNAAAKRLTNFKSIDDLFPPEVASRIQKKYTDIIQTKMRSDPSSYPTLSPEDKKIIKEDAVREAIEWGTNQALEGQTENVVNNQVLDPSHPLYGRMNPGQFGALAARADSLAENDWREANQLDDEKVAKINAGQLADRDENERLIADKQYRQNQNLLMLLDGMDMGLGHEVATWWQEKGGDYLAKVTDSYGLQANQSFQGNNFASTAGEVVNSAFQQYTTGLNQADSQYTAEMIQRNADLTAFANDAQSMQAGILSATPDLTDAERKQAFDKIIFPTLKDAKAKGLDFRSTNELVEQRIASYEGQTPEMRSLLKTLRRTRPETIQNYSKWATITKDFYPIGNLFNPGPSTMWFKEWQKESGNVPPRFSLRNAMGLDIGKYMHKKH